MKKLCIVIAVLLMTGFYGSIDSGIADVVQEKLDKMKSVGGTLEGTVNNLKKTYEMLDGDVIGTLSEKDKMIKDLEKQLRDSYKGLVNPGLPPVIKEAYEFAMSEAVKSLSLGSAEKVPKLIKGFYELLVEFKTLMNDISTDLAPVVDDLNPEKDAAGIYKGFEEAIESFDQAENQLEMTVKFFRRFEGAARG